MSSPSRPGRRVAFLVFARATAITAGLVTTYFLLPLEGVTADTVAWLVCGLLAVMVVFFWEVRTIARSAHPRLKAVEALAATVPLFLLLFASAYYLLGRSFPAAFSEPLTRTDALYFALTTFSTVGYGDITARSQSGRVLTMLQMAGGLLLVGVAARVVASAVQAGLQQRRGSATDDVGGERP
ncbi:potassium channel family protein [Streptomyces sp. NPDC052023]|uniref:potassium channel family protein n=1 Tax=Streptomyces sp. NPDC052023 TaxID=3365681 RepID=UPI0037CE0EE3